MSKCIRFEVKFSFKLLNSSNRLACYFVFCRPEQALFEMSQLVYFLLLSAGMVYLLKKQIRYIVSGKKKSPLSIRSIADVMITANIITFSFMAFV